MIDLVDLRNRPQDYQEACYKKGISFDVSKFLALDSKYRAALTEFEELRAEQNKLSKRIPTLSGSEKEDQLGQMKILSPKVKELSQSLKEIEEIWLNEQLKIPSIPDQVVPIGKDDSDNVEIFRFGTPQDQKYTPLGHLEIGERLELFDIERGVKVAGARNYFLCGDGARLQHAVLQLALDLMHKKNYRLMDVPHIVLKEAMTGTGYFPGGEDQAFELSERDSDHFLIGTSEVPVCCFHQNDILEHTELPKKYAGYSPCYRREAGSYGKDTKGLYRVHQFYKIEQVIICEADQNISATMHAELRSNAEEFLQALELPYRVVAVCTGDMGQGQVIKHDIEAWMPSRGSYGETHSCSTFYDFQSRRLKLRYRSSDGQIKYCHTLNNTLVASPRILIPLIENHQQADGTIKIPQSLRPFMAGQEFIGKVKI